MNCEKNPTLWIVVLTFGLWANYSLHAITTEQHQERLQNYLDSLASGTFLNPSKFTGLSDKACPNRPGIPYPGETPECSGNVLSKLSLPFTSVSLIHNSTASRVNVGIGPGWSISNDTRIVLTDGASGYLIAGDQSVIPVIKSENDTWVPSDSRQGDFNFELIRSGRRIRQRFKNGSVRYFDKSENNEKVFISYEEIDRYGQKISLERENDSFGLIQTIRFPEGLTITFHYDNQKLSRIETSSGLIYQLEYDEDFRLINVKYPNGTRWDIKYFPTTPWISELTNPAGIREKFTYFMGGIVQTYENSNGNKSTFHYTPTKVIIRNSAQSVTQTFDDQGRISSIEFGGPENKISYTRDSRGRLSQVTDPNGNYTTYSYVGSTHNIIRKRTYSANPSRETEYIRYTYNGQNEIRKVEIINADRKVRYRFDTNNFSRLMEIKTTENNKIFIRRYRYTDDNCLTIRNEINKVLARRCYDGQGRVVSETDAYRGVTQYIYENGRLATRINALGIQTHFQYNELGQVTEENVGGEMRITYQYNSMGELQQVQTQGTTSNASTLLTENYDWQRYPSGALQNYITTISSENRELYNEEISYVDPLMDAGVSGRLMSHTVSILGGERENMLE